MKITNKHVAITAAVLGLLVAGHYFMGLKGFDKYLHGDKVALKNGKKAHSVMAKEFENMCYEKGNVGMIQTLMLVDKYYE